ncbi:heavy metal-associated isoprenylated plant protein 32-like [Dioscorea cayenensis subsp. rotundata]|uniref:Heavy metal-associated isoprenylated plant protein 32-like n=1 Tax=Dioscorea cayennensis subsp. rotundata TaxID=55577 RepID=A0AB40AJH6_DIOCR|nr:heavy metal-associated isoprenylated plant protein 32-like [Dioscorea cayenensis subsp. rotundata]
MSGKEEFLKIQTCVLKVNIHCDGCKQKVKKLLQKIDGVYTTSIDAEQGKVIVSGNVDPATLIKKLGKAGKHAELWASSKGGNNPHFILNNQFQKLQLDNNGKGPQKDHGKPQKGGGNGGKDQKVGQQLPQLDQQKQQLLLQQLKGFKDVKLPNLKDLKLPFGKDPKAVKFNMPADDEGSDYDEFDDDDYDDEDDFDDLDGLDELEEDLKAGKMMKPPGGGGGGGGGHQFQGNPMGNDKKGNGANGKKGDAAQPQNKNDGKKNGNGNVNGNGNQNKNGGNGSANNNKGNQNNNNNNNGGKKGGGNNGGGGGGNQHPNMMMMNQMGNHHLGAAAAVQGLPANAVPPGYLQGGMLGGAPPEVIAAANPYQQQQYMAAIMQQRMMNGGAGGYDPRMYPPMSYGRPMPPPPGMAYMGPPPPPPGEPYTHFFSDENTNSCSIM